MVATIHALRPSQTETWGFEEEVPLGLQEVVAPEANDEVLPQHLTSTESLNDLWHELREIRTAISSSTRVSTLGAVPARYRDVHAALAHAIEQGAPIALRRPNDIPLHSLLRFAAAFTLIVCTGSLALWLTDLPPILNPFVSLLGIVASPFLYAMGRAAKVLR
jgi:hypothetical protein